jgi:hypothetical protein
MVGLVGMAEFVEFVEFAGFAALGHCNLASRIVSFAKIF